MSSLQDMADKLADDVLAAEEELGDDRFYEKVSNLLSAFSPSFQEAFMTAIRVRVAERKGREMLEQALAIKRGEFVHKPAAAPAPTPTPGATTPTTRKSGH